MKNMFNKMVLAVMAAALVFAAFPSTRAFAADDPALAPSGAMVNVKLEKAWARQLVVYENLGKLFNDSEAKLEKIQSLLDKAADNGRDVTAAQSALDAFEAALKATKPIYESMKHIVASHPGFDAKGRVTDAEKARATLKEMDAKLKEVKASLGGTGKALRAELLSLRKSGRPSD